MKKIILFAVTVLLFNNVICSAQTEQERRIQYALTSLNRVANMANWVSEINGNWYTNVTVPFVAGAANSTIDLSWGPALYRVGGDWTDTHGYALFSSYGSIKKIEAGMNYMDFPMYVSYWRNVSVKLPKAVASGDEVWVNGSRAWFDGSSWRAYVSAPWNMTELTIVWSGHGQWVVGVSSMFDYGQLIALYLNKMDTSITSPAQSFGISYLGDISWPNEQVMSVKGIQYDQTLEANVLVCSNILFKSYGSFKVMVTLQNYDENLGNSVQYFSKYLEVQDGVILIPLIDRNGSSFGIPDYTSVRFIYQDPADDGIIKQQWDNTLFTWPGNGGGKG